MTFRDTSALGTCTLIRNRSGTWRTLPSVLIASRPRALRIVYVNLGSFRRQSMLRKQDLIGNSRVRCGQHIRNGQIGRIVRVAAIHYSGEQGVD